MFRRTALITTVSVLFFALIVAPVPALAHANLVSCNVKNNEVFTVHSAPKRIIGHFAQALNPDHSWMQVFEGVADHGLVTEHQKSQISFTNAKVMTLKLPKLQPLKYYLIWYTHSAQDGHFAAGIVYFRVKK
ncbi:MAG TPA: copper resistance protein CopC [Chloroflexota bacterium]|jgi:methionine-rich copper-binding protein CopC|nr:copper resistance protein CopC [Chloroflexota bacterium]